MNLQTRKIITAVQRLRVILRLTSFFHHEQHLKKAQIVAILSFNKRVKALLTSYIVTTSINLLLLAFVGSFSADQSSFQGRGLRTFFISIL